MQADSEGDASEGGSRSAETPDMSSAASPATACRFVDIFLLLQLLANPANAVVEASEAAASNVLSEARLSLPDPPACR